MLSDVGSLTLALGALWLARRPPTARMSFGFRRAEILAALFNGVALVAIAIWIFIEAAQRLSDPPEILTGTTLAIALAGLAVNVLGVVDPRALGGAEPEPARREAARLRRPARVGRRGRGRPSSSSPPAGSTPTRS